MFLRRSCLLPEFLLLLLCFFSLRAFSPCISPTHTDALMSEPRCKGRVFVHVSSLSCRCSSSWSESSWWQTSACCEGLCWIRKNRAACWDSYDGCINLLNESKLIQHLPFGRRFHLKHLLQATGPPLESEPVTDHGPRDKTCFFSDIITRGRIINIYNHTNTCRHVIYCGLDL